MDVYGALFRHALWPAWERGLRRRPTLSILRDLRRAERASPDELEDRRRRALAALLRHAYDCVPFYRRRFDAAGVSPRDIRGPEDLAVLPALTRAEAREHGRDRVSRAPPYPVIRKTTGGTTGEPLVIAYDRESEYWRQAVKERAFSWAGYRPGDRALHYWGEATAPVGGLGSRLKRAADQTLRRQHFVDCTPRGEADLEAAVRAIRRLRPRVMFCYAQAATELARYVVREDARAWDDVRVICGAEPLYDGDRERLTEAFGGPVYETYGCRETMLIASECEARGGLHIAAENVVVELVVTEPTGHERPARPGELGEVVLTDLHNYGMPFIRYKNGDLAVAKEPSACACGRPHPRLDSVEGRASDTLRDGAGRAVGGMAFNLIVSPIADVVRAFQVVQHGDRSITFKVVPAPGFGDRALAHLRRNVSRYLPGVPVSIERVESIPKTRSGKHRLVVVETGATSARSAP